MNWSMKPLNFNDWKSTRLSNSSRRVVPEQPGVFLILRVLRSHGLPLSTTKLVARKAQNLRASFSKSLIPWVYESNELRELLIEKRTDELEFWFHKFPPDEISQAESILLQQTNLLLN